MLFHNSIGGMVIDRIAKGLVVMTGVIGDSARLDGVAAKSHGPGLRDIIWKAAMHDLRCRSHSSQTRSPQLDQHERTGHTQSHIGLPCQQIERNESASWFSEKGLSKGATGVLGRVEDAIRSIRRIEATITTTIEVDRIVCCREEPVEDLASLKGNEDRIPRSEIWWRQ
jgi:hypothetical protein